MALDARTTDLLQRFPDQLSQEEEAELHRLAEGDPIIAQLVEQLGELDAILDRPTPPEDADDVGELALSELGRRRLETELRGIVEAGSLGPTRSGTAAAPRRSLTVWMVVAAAVLLLGLGALLRPGPQAPPTDLDPLTPRGAEDAVKVELVVLGPDGPLASNAKQDPSVPVRFQAVASGATWLAMLESQAGRTVMLYPVAGAQWTTEGGVSPLQPPGQSPEYRPAQPGRAEYILVAAPGPIAVPTGPIDPKDLSILHERAGAVDALTIVWEAP